MADPLSAPVIASAPDIVMGGWLLSLLRVFKK